MTAFWMASLPGDRTNVGRHLLKARDRRIDGRAAVLRPARPAGRDEFTERRFVAQHEVCHRRLARARLALRSHDQVEIAALEARIEVREAEERAGVGRRQPQFAPCPVRGHRPAADASAHGPEPGLAAAAEGRQVQIVDRLLVGPDDAGDLEVDVEVLALGSGRRAPVDQRFDEGPRVQRGSAHRSLQRRRTVDDVDREIVARRNARLRDLGALHRAVGADFGRSAHHRGAQVDGDVAERGALGRGLDEERRLAWLSRGLRDARHGIVDARRREVDFDLRAGARQRRLELDRQRARQPRAEVEAALGARGGVEREGHGRRAFVARRSADLDMGRGAQELAVAHDLQIIAIGGERGRGGIEFFVGEELVDLKVGERPGGVELRVLGTRGLAELEVEGEIAFRLPLDGRGIDRKTRLAAQRLARQEIGERVGRTGHVRMRRSVDNGSGRRVGNAEDEVARLDAPRRRQRHCRVLAGNGELVAGEGSRTFVGHHHRQAGHEVDADVARRELAMEAVARQPTLVGHRVEVGGRPIRGHRSLELTAVQIARAPLAHVGIDELRPQANKVGRRARAGLNGELERGAIAVRRGFDLDDRIDGRSARREAVDDKPRRRFEVARVEDDGLESDRVGAARSGPNCASRDSRCVVQTLAASAGGATQPCASTCVSPARTSKLVDAKPLRVLVPSDVSGRFVDEKRDGVGVVDSDASGADAEPSG